MYKILQAVVILLRDRPILFAMQQLVTLLRFVSDCHTATEYLTLLPPYWLLKSMHADVP